jgi:hypothetical protein
MDRVGFSNISGDYELRPATGDECKVSKAQLSDVLRPVSVVQSKHTVEFKGKGLVGCGVVVGTVVVMKPRECGGTTPFRLVGKVTDPGIEMTIWDKTSGTHCFLGTLTRRSAQR